MVFQRGYLSTVEVDCHSSWILEPYVTYIFARFDGNWEWWVTGLSWAEAGAVGASPTSGLEGKHLDV